MSFSKPTKVNRFNLAAKMNDLANDEILEKSEDFYLSYAQNIDLFREKSLAIRPGVTDLCGGFVWGEFHSTQLIDTISGIDIANTTLQYDSLYSVTQNQEHDGFLFIPSRDTVLKSGTFFVRGRETQSDYVNILGQEALYDIDVRCMIFPTDQSPFTASGVSAMSGIPPSSGYHDISLSYGNYNAPPYPTIWPRITPFSTGIGAIGIGEQRVNLGTYGPPPGSPASPVYTTADTQVNMNFNAPIPLSGNIVYYGRLVYGLTSGTQTRNVQFKNITNTGVDLSPNSVMVNEFQYVNPPNSQNYALKTSFGGFQYKTWPLMNLWSYDSCDFLNPDFPSANHVTQTPTVSGLNSTQTGISLSNYRVGNPSAAFGQLMYLPSGNTYYGGYLWAAPENPNGTYNFFNADGTVLSGRKDIGIITRLSLIGLPSGDISNATYKANNLTTVAQTSGTYTFDFDTPYNNAGIKNDIGFGNSEFNYRLNKIYTMFDNPVTLTESGHYLLNFDWYDTETGGKFKDYSLRVASPTVSTYISALGVGTNSVSNYSGTFLYDYSGINVYQQIPTSHYVNSPAYDLTCGLIYAPSGSWINGLYDYRVGGDRVSKIVYGQSQFMRTFDLNNPDKSNHVTIFSSGSLEQDALWNFVTYDDIMFAHQYSQISGICWNQTSGVQLHGLQPRALFTTNGAGAIATGMAPFVSGLNYNVLLLAQMDTGGFRTQQYTLTANSGMVAGGSFVSGAVFQIKNPDNTANFSLSSQYNFDLFGGSQGKGTYVFITPTSGVNYYLAPLYSGTTVGPNTVPISQPISNSGLYPGANGLYIGRPAIENLDLGIATVTSYPLNYFISQVPTPKFKKMLVFYDYVLGIGDPDFNTRLWYSEQFAPQIWGEAFDFHGFIDVDKDSGSPLTSMEKLGQYTILFKKNSTYRLEFLGNSSQPFAITPIDTRIGSLGAFGTISVGDNIYGLSQYGVFSCNGAQVKIISDAIKPFYDNLNHDDLTFSTVIHDMNHTEIIWSISNNGFSSESEVSICYNYKQGSFYIRKGTSWNIAATVENVDSFDVLLGGTFDGQIQVVQDRDVYTDTVFNDGSSLSSAKNIEFIAETPWLGIGDSQFQKQIRFVDLNVSNSDCLIAIDVYFNNNSTTKAYTRYLDLNGNSSDKRVILGGQAKTVKFVFRNIGKSVNFKIDSLSVWFNPLGFNNAM